MFKLIGLLNELNAKFTLIICFYLIDVWISAVVCLLKLFYKLLLF